MNLVEEVSDVQARITDCIDAGLKQLGPSVSQAICFHAKKNFGVRKEDIPRQPEAFSQALHSIFGNGGKVIERLIVQKIQERFQLCLEPETSLVNAVHAVKKGSKTTTKHQA